MPQKDPTIPREQAEREVALAVERLALLHLSYAQTLFQELGEERGRELTVQAIREYGLKIAAKAREGAEAQGLPLTPENYDAGGPNWPSLGACDRVERVVVEADGVHPSEPRTRIYGCGLAKCSQAQGQEALGRLYCLIDVAKMMAYNPDYKVIHLQAELDGDPYCELATRRTTAQEREDFGADKDWSYIDQG
jgi:hypothetical protein